MRHQLLLRLIQLQDQFIQQAVLNTNIYRKHARFAHSALHVLLHMVKHIQLKIQLRSLFIALAHLGQRTLCFHAQKLHIIDLLEIHQRTLNAVQVLSHKIQSVVNELHHHLILFALLRLGLHLISFNDSRQPTLTRSGIGIGQTEVQQVLLFIGLRHKRSLDSIGRIA